MTHRRDPRDDTPPWLGLVRHPGVVETIAMLHNHGPASFDALRAYVEFDGDGLVTAEALRRLAAWRMCQRHQGAGTWDQRVRPAGPQTVYELTDYGHRFAEVMAGWRHVVAQMPPDLRNHLHQYR